MTLQELFDHGADAAAHLFERQGHLVPMWVGVNKRGSHVPLVIPYMDDKDSVAETVKKYLKKERITQYVSMLECWTYEGKEIPPEITEGRSLEHNPDRREAIHIMAEDEDGNTIAGCFYILRPEHGKPKLSPLKMYPNAEASEGRFVRMFD